MKKIIIICLACMLGMTPVTAFCGGDKVQGVGIDPPSDADPELSLGDRSQGSEDGETPGASTGNDDDSGQDRSGR